MSLIFWGLITLGILVTIHEGGHFLAAKLLGVKVEKFSIGFGPKLIGFKKGETEYRISLLPLGGYVKMKGETPQDETNDEDDEFLGKKWWEKIIIAFAGPFANFIFAIILFIFSFMIGQRYEDFKPVVGKVNFAEFFMQQGDTIVKLNDNDVKGWNHMLNFFNSDSANIFEIKRNDQILTFKADTLSISAFVNNVNPQTSTIVGSVTPGYPAYLAGIRENDKIVKINGKDVKNWYQLRNSIAHQKEQEVEVTFIRNEQTITKTMKLSDNILEKGSKIIGITQYLPVTIKERFGLMKSVKYGLAASITTIVANYSGVIKLIQNPAALKDNIGGPVMVAAVSKQYSDKGFSTVITFIAIISILLMVMNLLPIPILDGGQIMFSVIEGIKGSPLKIRTQEIMQQIGLVFLLSLTIYVFFNDFSRITTRFNSIKNIEKSESVDSHR